MKKILAYLFMSCGIVAEYFVGILPACVIIALQILGYLSMPFFAQAVVEGFFLTRNVYKYLIRIALTAYLTQIVCLLGYLFLDGIPSPTRFNGAFTWPITLAVLVGAEFLVSLPRDRIASMNLLDANPTTHSSRYDVVITSSEANNLPVGLKVPKWPKSTFHGLAIVLFAFAMILITFLPLTMALLSVVCVLIFYFLHRWKIDSRIFVASAAYLALAACYTYVVYRLTGTLSLEWTSILGFLLCLLLPSKRRKKSRLVYRLCYLIFPAVTGLALILSVVFGA